MVDGNRVLSIIIRKQCLSYVYIHGSGIIVSFPPFPSLLSVVTSNTPTRFAVAIVFVIAIPIVIIAS